MKILRERQYLSLTLACLGGCAGGGGGNNATPYPPLISVTPSTALSVVSSTVTFNNPTSQFAAAGGTVGMSASGNGSAITTLNLSVTGVGTPGANFQQTFSTFTPQVDSNGVLYFASVTAPDGSVRQILFANPGYALLKLTYMTLGFWEYDTSTLATSGVGGAFVVGTATRATDLPTQGTAKYTGGMIGRYADGTTSWAVTANASSTANFGTGTVSLTTSNSSRAPVNGGAVVADANLNLSAVAPLLFSPGTNQVSGTLTSTGGMTGPASAKFYGPGAQELGGTFFITNGGNQQMNGAFGLHR